MTRHPDGLGQALDALRVHDAGAFSWFGERTETEPRIVREWPEDALWDVLAARIQRVLYNCYFTQGAASRGVDRRLTPATLGRADLQGPLAAVASRNGPLEDGWDVVGSSGDAVVVRRDGVTIRAARTRFHPDEGAAGRTGAIRLPPSLPHRSPGHVVLLGERALPAGASLARVYWNLLGSRAVEIAAAIVTAFGDVGVPFEFKALADSSAYTRCDAGVLYVARDDLSGVLEIARGVAARHVDGIKTAVPALTERVAPGVAWAEDPGGGESFGMHRCGLIAGGVVAAHRRGDAGGSRTRVEAAFAAAGLSLDAPHRRGASTAVAA